MKALKYLTAILFFFLFTACSEDKDVVQIGPRGVVENDVFTDDRYGLELAIPEGWEVDDTSKYGKNTILRLNHGENNNFIFASEPLLPAQHFKDYFGEKYQLEKSRSSLASIFGVNSNNLATKTVDINDVEFYLLNYRYKKEGVKGKLMYAQYFLQTGRDVITIRTTGEVKMIDELKLAMEGASFASLPPADDSQVTIDRAYYQKGKKSADAEGFFSLHDYVIKMPIPENYSIERNIYADGWSTKFEKDNQNHIVVTEKFINKGLSFEKHIENAIKEINTSVDKKIVKLKSRKIDDQKYKYFNMSKAVFAGLMMEKYKEEFIKKNSKEEYDKEYEKVMEAEKESGFVVFVRDLNDGEFLNIELTYTNKESQNELMEMIEGIISLKI